MQRAGKEARMKNRSVMLVAVLGLSVGLAGCRNDCRSSCEKYQECVASDFNVDQCTDTCGTRSKSDEAFQTRAEDCSACVEGKTCSEATGRCWDECLSVVLAQP
jgi:hypothetical protein